MSKDTNSVDPDGQGIPSGDDGSPVPEQNSSPDGADLPDEHKQRIARLENEASHQFNFQVFLQLQTDWNGRLTEELHDALQMLIMEYAEQHDGITTSEVGIALWNELVRLERQARSEAGGAQPAVQESDQQSGAEPHGSPTSPGGLDASTDDQDSHQNDPAFH